MPPRNSSRPRRVLSAALIDIVVVTAFAITGRASHAEGLSFSGIVGTVWPFLVALAVGWVATLAWRHPFGLPLPAVPLWIITVAVGMVLRVIAGGGIATPFVLVATGVLGVLLLGWRAIASAAPRRRRKR